MSVFTALAFVLSLKMDSPYFAVLYMVFDAMVFTTVPFSQDQLSEAGFINMLPGTIRNRVAGRYLFAMSMLLIGTVLGVVIIAIDTLIIKVDTTYAFAVCTAFAGVGMMLCSLQYILFYAIGKGKSAQATNIVRIIPSFLMFFGVSYLVDWVQDHPQTDLNWVYDNANLLAFGLVVIGLILYLIGILISSAIVSRRDQE